MLSDRAHGHLPFFLADDPGGRPNAADDPGGAVAWSGGGLPAQRGPTDDPGGAVAWRGLAGDQAVEDPGPADDPDKRAADAGSRRSLADDPGGADAEQKSAQEVGMRPRRGRQRTGPHASWRRELDRTGALGQGGAVSRLLKGSLWEALRGAFIDP